MPAHATAVAAMGAKFCLDEVAGFVATDRTQELLVRKVRVQRQLEIRRLRKTLDIIIMAVCRV